MALPLYNYLQTYRKRTGFSQAEMAFLLGIRSGAKVSRHEHGARQPSLRTAFVYEVVFGVTLRDLFAGSFREIERTTRKRAEILMRKLNVPIPDQHTLRKIQILKAIVRK